MESLHADVWVVGSGAAGLMAAITARLEGADVAVVSKSGRGKGTSTTFAVGSLAGPVGGLDANGYKSKVLSAGRGLNDLDLVDIAASEAEDRFRDLVEWGMNAETAEGVFLAVPEDDPGDRMPVWGREIVRALVPKAEEIGVRFVDNFLIRSISADDHGVAMAAYSARQKSWMELRGGAAILAAGGASALYLNHSNPQRMGGDSNTLAFEAGCIMQDMEFIQFYPVAINEPGKPVFLIESASVDQGKLINSDGENVLEKHQIHQQQAAKHARDALAQALFDEIEVNGKDVFIDLSGIPKEVWCNNPVNAKKWAFLDTKFDAWNRPLRVAPVAHFSGGGARTDATGATNVPGLYAAGEAAATGIHGANRMGGNALTECLVFGHRAAKAACDFASKLDKGLHAKPAGTPKETGEPTANLNDLRTELSDLMWRFGGIRRDAKGLAKGLSLVRTIAAKAQQTRGINEPRLLEKYLELQLATQAAELILEAAHRRQESRGNHARQDFPDTDDAAWRGHLQAQKTASGTEWWFEPLTPSDVIEAAD